MSRFSRKFFMATALAGFSQTSELNAQTNKEVKATYAGGSTFTHRVSFNRSPNTRDITIDCRRMQPVRLLNGDKRIAPTVSFINLFDILTTQGMDKYSAEERKAIETAHTNRSVDRNQIAFMVGHVAGAHGVKYDEIRSAALACEQRVQYEP